MKNMVCMYDMKFQSARAHQNSSPPLRAMFYEFPENSGHRELQDQYVLSSKYLIASILHLNRFRWEDCLRAGGSRPPQANFSWADKLFE
ncbi:MAG: hypothetical protein HFG02_06370 [Oscillibacter sp.]|nr:hypothetical protein [Oscillibacter sp.]